MLVFILHKYCTNIIIPLSSSGKKKMTQLQIIWYLGIYIHPLVRTWLGAETAQKALSQLKSDGENNQPWSKLPFEVFCKAKIAQWLPAWAQPNQYNDLV